MPTNIATPRPAATVKAGFAELSVVALLCSVAVGGKFLPRGARGTVVGIYGGGEGYEVEFTSPFHAVVTLAGSDLTA